MSVPNITSPIHASVAFDSGGIIQGLAVNVVSVTRNAAGDYTIVLGSEIDVGDRSVVIQTLETGDFTAQHNPVGDTDAQFNVVTRVAAVATNCACRVTVFRTNQPV